MGIATRGCGEYALPLAIVVQPLQGDIVFMRDIDQGLRAAPLPLAIVVLPLQGKEGLHPVRDASVGRKCFAGRPNLIITFAGTPAK